MAKKKIILGVTGSIAIYKACDLVRRFIKEGLEVIVVMTEEAKEFIRPLLFERLTNNKVYSNLFEQPDFYQIEHVSLAEQADLVLIAPATANVIAKISSGICDDLLTCVVLATKAKVLIAPAMNDKMYTNKITQANIKKLKSLGYKFIGPREGRLVCGARGKGCLSKVEDIVREVKKSL